ncbi:transposase [Streptomyces gardneri]|nr:transposase [Streptomyces gardneri]
MDRDGTPLTVTPTGGHRHDVTQLLPLLDAVPPIRGRRGRPRRKPRRLYAERGYDFDKYRRLLRKRGIKPLIARSGVAHGSGLGKARWVVERAFAWLPPVQTAPYPIRTTRRSPPGPPQGRTSTTAPTPRASATSRRPVVFRAPSSRSTGNRA